MFLNYPFVKQNELKDCGVACLAMIIRYYKGYIGLETLRDMTNTNKAGTSAYDLINTANDIGFEAIGVKTSLNIDNKIILPCIAHLLVDNKYYHYVVIYKIDYKKRKLIIADPANNISTISFDNFNKIWSNVLVMMHPVKNIPVYQKHSILKFLLDLMLLNKSLIKSMLMLSLIITSFTIASSFFIQILLSAISLDDPTNKVVIIAMIFLFIEIVKTLSDYMRNKILIFLNQKIDLILTTDTYKNILTLPYKYYRNHTTGEILSKIYELSAIRNIVGRLSLTIFIDAILTITASVVLLLLSQKLFFISLLIFITYLLIILFFKDKINNSVVNLQREKANTSSFLVESINGFETIKGLDLNYLFINKFESKYIKLLKKIFDLDSLHNKQYLFKQLINNISSIIILTVGMIMVINDEITIGTLLTFHMLSNYFLYPISSFAETHKSIKEAENAMNRIFDLSKKTENNGIIKKQLDGNIKIRNLNYSFNNDDTFLKNIDINIKKGEKIMLTGESGSGKSTILKIIKGYYTTQRDVLYLDEVDSNDLDKHSIDGNITYVSQNELLFTDTIINNVNLDKTTVDHKITKLLKIFRIDKIVKSPLGYNTLIEENGFNLSGGERQRIILARSLVYDRPIIMIDEGFSQMDINLERAILKDIFNNFKDKTIIISSHRIDNLDLFDRLIEVNSGRIVKDILKNG